MYLITAVLVKLLSNNVIDDNIIKLTYKLKSADTADYVLPWTKITLAKVVSAILVRLPGTVFRLIWTISLTLKVKTLKTAQKCTFWTWSFVAFVRRTWTFCRAAPYKILLYCRPIVLYVGAKMTQQAAAVETRLISAYDVVRHRGVNAAWSLLQSLFALSSAAVACNQATANINS